MDMDQDLIDLLAAWKGKDLEAARLDQLGARLRQDEAFQQAFVDEIRMLGMLKVVQSTEPRWLKLQDALGWGPGARAGEEELEDAFMRRVQDILPLPRPRPRSWAAPAAAAALLLLVAGGLVARAWSWPWPWQRPRPVATRPASDPANPPPASDVRPVDGLALVVKLDAVLWGPSGRPRPAEGTVLCPGRFRLDAGRVMLSFFSGVTLTVEGPADFDLVAGDRVFCRRGRLRARVPEGAEGFVVASPGSAVVDLGTEFGLNVEDGGKSRIMVFEGTAEAALLDAQGAPWRTQPVARDRSFAIDVRAGRIEETAAEPASFVPAPASAAPPLALDPGYAAAVLGSRPRSYWRFEALSDGAFPNEVAGGPPLRAHGPVALDAGAGNGCVLFGPGAPEQYLDTEGPWELARDPGHAVEFWFLPEGFRHATLVGLYPPVELIPPGRYRYPHTLLAETTARERQSLNKPASVRFLHRSVLTTTAGDNTFSEDVYVPRRWHHVVAQKAGDRMELYVDGTPGRSVPLDPDHPTRSCYLVVGRRTPDAGDPKDVRPFVGRLDELALYDRPLAAEEVRRHFRLAAPRAVAD
jgi:hypothetical protein